MVGVPGQSKGCNTCRKRKKGCDLQRPECSQCIKAGLACAGYERERIFVNQGFSTQKRKGLVKTVAQPRSRKKSPGTSSLSPSNTGWLSESPEIDPAQGGMEVASFSDGKILYTFGPLRLATPSSASLFQAQFFSLFCSQWLPIDNAAVGPSYSWIEVLPDLRHSDPALQAATTALSTARLGQVNSDAVLKKESLKLYGLGLRRLQDALWDEQRMHSDETLASALILALYEILECTEDRGYAWMSHTQGAARLVQLRGPEMHRSNLSHRLFLGLRGTAITNAIASRKATFLAEEDWLTSPFKTYPKNIQQELYDIMVHLPAILEEVDGIVMESRRRYQLSRRLNLLERCWNLHDDFITWYVKLIGSKDKPPFWYEPTQSDNPPPSDTRPNTCIRFHSLLVANALCLYWASLELVIGTMFQLYYTLPPSFDRSTLRPLDGENEHNVRYLAQNIMQSMEYFLQPKMGGLGPNLTLLPLRVAMQFFVFFPGEEEAKWCLGIFEQLKNLGIPFGTFLATVKAQDWPTEKGDVAQLDPRETFNDGKQGPEWTGGLGVPVL